MTNADELNRVEKEQRKAYRKQQKAQQGLEEEKA